MKKLFFSFLLLGYMISVSAQVIDKAIGVRMGYGGEVSYQQPVGNANRLEFDFGVNQYGLGVSGLYQWVWDLSAITDGFNWYAGVGGSVGSFYFGTVANSPRVLNVGLLGQVGMEYNFDIPLQLSLDYRPALFFLNTLSPTYNGICLSARYRF